MLRRSACLLFAALAMLSVPFGILARTASAQTIAACPSGVTITVAPPAAAAPTTVSVTVTPALNIKPAAAVDTTSFHLHYFVDTAPTATGTEIPIGDAKIIHSATTTQDLGSLSLGQHTVVVVLGQLNHTACDARGSVTFTVGQAAVTQPVGAATPVAPRAGNAGLFEAGGVSRLTVALLVGAVLLVTLGGRAVTGRGR